MFKDIKKAIERAEENGQKVAMLHLQVLLNAKAVRDVDPKVFCEQIGMTQSFATEVRKMLALDRLMAEKGKQIS